MTKAEIEKIFNNISNNYTWKLYLFGKDGRSSDSPYKFTRVNFENSDEILNFGENLVECIKKYQLDKITEIENYCGENSKITCDSLELTNEVISENWGYFETSLRSSVIDSNENVKIKGYVFSAIPKTGDLKKILFVKKANPIIKGEKRKSKTFKADENNTLNSFNDKIYRFYLTIDFFIIDNILYTFNFNFEEIFGLEKTLNIIKTNTIETIFLKDFLKNENKKLFQTIPSQMYLNLNKERLNELDNIEKRQDVANNLNLEIENGKFNFNDLEQIKSFIKYLSNRIIQEEGTGKTYEITGTVKEI